MAENGLSVGVRSVQQILIVSKHLKFKKIKCKPMMSAANVEGLKKFALDQIHWKNQGRKIIFSDANLDVPDGCLLLA